MADQSSKSRKLWLILLIVASYIGLVYVGCLLLRPKTVQNPEESIERIDSLESKIDSIYIVKDSIQEKIDTVYIKLEENNKQYEEDFNNILNNDGSEDLLFFLDYINSNKTRLDSISNHL